MSRTPGAAPTSSGGVVRASSSSQAAIASKPDRLHVVQRARRARWPRRSAACRPRTGPAAAAQVERSSVTVAIMSPPPCHGGIRSSSAARPYSTPMPVGPNSLCPEKAKKSQPSACTSTGQMGRRLRAVHQHHDAPRPRSLRRARRTGLIVPSALERCATATSRVRSLSRRSNASRSSSPVLGDRRGAQHGSGLLGHELPGDDVRVVLHPGDQDLVARLEATRGPSSGPPG